MSVYDPKKIEERWLGEWESHNLFQGVVETSNKKQPTRYKQAPSNKKQEKNGKKLYLLYAFAYPSGEGLHVGHVEPLTALDISARFNRMQGRDVFFPVGWDAFGLPAENYAIKTGVHPAKTTRQAIDTFRQQIKRIGISYDWESELATSHPGYYKWTQWIFLKLFEKGLAYKANGTVNWCPSCQTVLANEQVVDGACERCGTEVVQKELEQWYFKITDYKDELISGLEQVDWPKATEEQQKNWIGRSEGAEVRFKIYDSRGKKELDDVLAVYTTAHDTIFGCTFMVVAPEHELLQKYKKRISNWSEVSEYIHSAESKSELERQANKDKTGVLVEGVELVNPVNDEKLPLFVADYVLAGYGTGAIMAVPGEDERDFEFATKFGLRVVLTAKRKGEVKEGDEKFVNYEQIKNNRSGFELINSDEFNGMSSEEAMEKIPEKFPEAIEKVTTYRLRDWLISRQRYWGAPIPIVYDPQGRAHAVREEHLPWELPTDVEFKPTGESPLTHSKEFKARVEKLYGKGWRPEYDTMDTFVGSSWYFLRYVSARDEKVFADKAQMKKWLPVDFYMIGPEHIVLHLLYSRFFSKFLRDEGYLEFDEPFLKMRHQGMILGPDHKKMSKSKGNVIDPDVVISKFGADTLRMYEMFMGPIDADKPWSMSSAAGVYRFLEKVYGLVQTRVGNETSRELVGPLNKTIKKVGGDIEKLKFNTAISALMEFSNAWRAAPRLSGSSQTARSARAFGSEAQARRGDKTGQKSVPVLSRGDTIKVVKLLAPFAPFVAEELFQSLGGQKDFESVHTQDWPEWDEGLTGDELVVIPVQVNGKLRGQVRVEAGKGGDKEGVVELARKDEKVARWLKGKTEKRVVWVPRRLVNFVVS